ncbi:MAG: hypothetical protein JXR10_13925 [Cyclobacteriaceae bacterium]
MLIDSTTLEPVQFAHITNYSSGEMVLSNVDGRFAIKSSVGDTVVCSIVGYEVLGWEVRSSWLKDGITLKLPQDTFLLESVTVNNIPEEHIFKQRILAHEVDDTAFWYHGVEKPTYRDNPMLNERVIKNPLFIATHPLSALYYNFSKQEKENRKYHQVTQNNIQQQRVNYKFTREWVKEVTALEGDQLTSFIFYCDYSLDYLDKTPLYIIQEDMLAKLEKFQRGDSEKG